MNKVSNLLKLEIDEKHVKKDALNLSFYGTRR